MHESIRTRAGRRRASFVAVTALAAGAMGFSAHADLEDRPFDFSDAFYRANGVDPDRIINRVNGQDGVSVFDETNDPDRRGVRVILTIPSFDHSGHALYFNAFGDLRADSFTNNAAGREAREIADESPIYIFPRSTNPPTEIFPKRQDDIIDLTNGYFSNNPLGLWVFVFVSYTDAAFDTEEGREALADLAERNGLDLDGTPLIKTTSEIESLVDRGFARLTRRNVDGSQGSPWSICPVIEDPTDGGIAPDAFLAIVEREDGTPLPSEVDLARHFRCLQLTGDWCNNPFGLAADILAVNVIIGELVSGDLNDLRENDDRTLIVRSEPNTGEVTGVDMEMIVRAEADAVDVPRVLDITVASRLDDPGGTAVLEIRNWRTGGFDLLATYPLGVEEVTRILIDVDATDHVRGQRNLLELRIRHNVLFAFTLNGFHSFFDVIEIRAVDE